MAVREDQKVVGVDLDLNLYDLTSLFYSYYKYHNDYELFEYNYITGVKGDEVQSVTKTMSRFDTFRAIEAMRLGRRPWPQGAVPLHRPNTSFGYMRLFLDYLCLPYKAQFTEGDIAKVRVNRKLHDELNLSKKEKDDRQVQEATNPNIYENHEISENVTDAFTDVLKTSNPIQKCFDKLPLKLVRDGAMAMLHSDLDYKAEPVDLLDFVFEPLSTTEVNSWNMFFVIKRMKASEVIAKIKDPGEFWNEDALRWALENSRDKRGILDSRHYYGSLGVDDSTPESCGENFMIQSFMQDKKQRVANIHSYFGDIMVVEGYYLNTDRKVNKVIFFPSHDVLGLNRTAFTNRAFLEEDRNEISKSDVLFHRENVFENMKDALTVIPFDRSEEILERQRAYGHEIFSPIEAVMRIDSSILQTVHLMSIGFYNSEQGDGAQNIEDLELQSGELQNLHGRNFVNSPFNTDLQAMLAARNILLQHVASKCFLGGLDGNELKGNGRGAELASLKLVRDGRIHKHSIEDYGKGITEFLTKVFRLILQSREGAGVVDEDLLLERYFFDPLLKLYDYPDDLFEFNDKDIVEDTGLPWWFRISSVRNGGSHFGPAEVYLYTTIMNLFAPGMDQQQLERLNRNGIRSLLGTHDALEILGDPEDIRTINEDQKANASLESGALSGAVTQGILDFTPIEIRPTKDDHVLHLQSQHNPDMQKFIDRLNEGDVTPNDLQEFTEDQLETRINLVLKLGSHANHAEKHLTQLDRFGKNRKDINELKEQTNGLVQAAEALVNNVTVELKILNGKREEKELRLRNISPENEAEKAKIEQELMELEAKKEIEQGKLALANALREDRNKHHADKQLTQSRNRQERENKAIREELLRVREQDIQREVALSQADQSGGISA